MTQRNTHDALAWLAADRKAGRAIWGGACLKRARSARNFPSVYPSALAAQHAVPMSDRIDRTELLKRKSVQGLVGFADDPNDSNPFGHVYTFIGRNKAGVPIVDTNDAFGYGRGWVVTYDWFKANWGDDFQFASLSLNGFALDLPGGNKNPTKHPTDPQFKLHSLDYAIHRLEKAIIWREKHKPGQVNLIRALKKDLAELKQTRHAFPKGGN